MRILTNNNILDILFNANCLLYNCLFLKRVHIVNLKKILFINTIMFTIINYDSYQRLNLHIMQCYYDSNHQIAYMSVFSVQTFTHCVVFSVNVDPDNYSRPYQCSKFRSNCISDPGRDVTQ